MIQVTGHRGARELAPENTLAGFALAWELGCHAVELDVHLTHDDKLAVIHDSTVDRTTDGAGPVSSLKLDDLRQYDAGNGQHIPSLEDVLEFLQPSPLLIQIELKGSGTEKHAPGVVRKMGLLPNRVRFTSFFHRRLLEAKRLFPAVQTGVLTDTNPVDPIHMLRSARADTFHIKHPRLDEWLVNQIHGFGHRIVAMGKILDETTVDHLIGLRVDVIGSDRPDMVIRRLKEHDLYRSPLECCEDGS